MPLQQARMTKTSGVLVPGRCYVHAPTQRCSFAWFPGRSSVVSGRRGFPGCLRSLAATSRLWFVVPKSCRSYRLMRIEIRMLRCTGFALKYQKTFAMRPWLFRLSKIFMKSLWSATESLCLLYAIPVIVVVRQANRWRRGMGSLKQRQA